MIFVTVGYKHKMLTFCPQGFFKSTDFFLTYQRWFVYFNWRQVWGFKIFYSLHLNKSTFIAYSRLAFKRKGEKNIYMYVCVYLIFSLPSSLCKPCFKIDFFFFNCYSAAEWKWEVNPSIAVISDLKRKRGRKTRIHSLLPGYQGPFSTGRLWEQ